MTPLDDLQKHWGAAYHIAIGEGGWWTAIRRDNAEVLSAPSAAGLRIKIRADYAARPVARKD